MRAIILSIFLSLISISAFASDQFCTAMNDFEQSMYAKLPLQIDDATELIQIRSNCEGKRITYVKRILVDQSTLLKGWLEKKQRQHTQFHCNRVGLASVNNWTAIDIINNVDYQYITTFYTSPKDCLKLLK